MVTAAAQGCRSAGSSSSNEKIPSRFLRNTTDHHENIPLCLRGYRDISAVIGKQGANPPAAKARRPVRQIIGILPGRHICRLKMGRSTECTSGVLIGNFYRKWCQVQTGRLQPARVPRGFRGEKCLTE